MSSLSSTPDQEPLLFLKLGGSLITNKAKPYSARSETISRLVEEIASFRKSHPHQRMVLGHGSGSFGHTSAEKYQTRKGVHTPDDWQGFVKVHQDARRLHQLVLSSLSNAGIPAVSFPPSSSVTAQQRRITAWNLQPLQAALSQGLLPVIHGDVVFDTAIGGTILSTEELFRYLALALNPDRILLVGQDAGVWADFPTCTTVRKKITPGDLSTLGDSLSASASPDVTGGMEEKVKEMLKLIQLRPHLEVLIFSGMEAGQLGRALSGESPGTRLYQPPA